MDVVVEEGHRSVVGAVVEVGAADISLEVVEAVEGDIVAEVAHRATIRTIDRSIF